jgi:hypothetical protein
MLESITGLPSSTFENGFSFVTPPFRCYSNLDYNGNVEVLAGIALILASFVFMMAIVRMLQTELRKGKDVGLATWFIFGAVILFPITGTLAGVYVIFFQ